MRCLSLMVVMIAFVLTSCSSTKGPTTKKTRYDRNFISYEDILSSAATNAYVLISNLRPQWLQGRGSKSVLHEEENLPMVYVNNDRWGTIESLHSISVANIKSVQYLSSSDATIRFGLNHVGGAILITIE